MSDERDSYRNEERADYDEEDPELGMENHHAAMEDVEPEPEGPPPGRNKIEKPEKQAQILADDEEEENPMSDTLLKDGPAYDKEEDKPAERKTMLIAALVMLLVFALLLILGLVYKTNNDPIPNLRESSTPAPHTGDVVTPAPTPLPEITKSPTKSPTAKATKAPTPLDSGTPFPTSAPIAPTFGGPSPVSRLPCNLIRNDSNVTANNLGKNNFEIITLDGKDHKQVCGDTFAGFDPERPNRNEWTATIGRRDCVTTGMGEGTAVCEQVGARRCTADELATGAAQGTGCGGDNFLLYSSSACVTDEGESGYYKVNYALKTNGTFWECEPNYETVKTIIRCCGDLTVPGFAKYDYEW